MALYGKQKQLKRVAIYNDFCKKTEAVLFATDIAARGLGEDFLPFYHLLSLLGYPILVFSLVEGTPSLVNTKIPLTFELLRLN